MPIDLTWEPLDVDSRYAAGLKPGMVIESVGNVIGAAWANKDSKGPSFVLGIAVK